MRSVFADTFYWVALTSPADAAHERALSVSRSIAPDRIVTTDEVLAEYFAFFASTRPSIRAQAGRNVAELLKNNVVTVVPQSRQSLQDSQPSNRLEGRYCVTPNPLCNVAYCQELQLRLSSSF